MIRPTPALLTGLALLGLAIPPLAAQQPPPPPSTAPSPAQTNPLPTTTAPNPPQDPGKSAAPAPEQALRVPVPAQAGAAPSATPPAAARQTLVETPGDANDVDSVSLPAKPAAIVSGKAKWEEALPSLKQAFARIEADLAKANIKPVGRPLAVFTRTDDDGFQYEAMIPIEQMPDAKPPEGEGLRFGTTPSGKALRFPHRGSYEAIDGTYETLTAYLDAKDIVVQDRFVEEYVTDLKDTSDDQLDVNIYALVR